jgi:purine-cytosine permease-like protein
MSMLERDAEPEAMAFHVEQHGIDFIPEQERWASPKALAGMWAGSALNIENFIYGAILMGFGFSFWTAATLIVIGNLSYFLLAIASLQGPQGGTTTFTLARAAFGTRGSKILALFNWVTMLGFEAEGLILIVGAVAVLCETAGFTVSNPAKVLFIVVATTLQAVLPYFGHATMVKVLRRLIVPFVIIFLVFAYFAFSHGHVISASPFGGGWELKTAGLAFVIALSGLGWAECGNDYSRYLPTTTPTRSVVGWVFLGTALPQVVVMLLGALAFTFLSGGPWSLEHATSSWNGANPFEAFRHGPLPTWFLVMFLIVALCQLFAINSLDLYSSGVSLQALVPRLKRYQCVVFDSVLAGLLTTYATFASSFSLYMKEFVGVIIVWIAPWFGVFITDWLLRRRRYEPLELQRTDEGGRYFASHGLNWNGLIGFAAGLVCATLAFSKAPPPINFPLHWMTPLSNALGGSCATFGQDPCTSGYYGGADFSVPLGMVVGALVYLVAELVTSTVKRQRSRASAPLPTK